MSNWICKGKDVLVGNGGPCVKGAICIPVSKPAAANSKVDTLFFDLEDYCRKLRHIEGVLHSALGKDVKDIGIGGKGVIL